MKKVFLLVVGLWSSVAFAQAPGGNNELLMSLYDQLQALQQEVQTLRGTVEEQSNQLRRFETEQRNRYLDIDRRLSGGAEGVPGAADAVAGAGGQIPSSEVPAGVPPASNAAPAASIAGTNPAITAAPGSQVPVQSATAPAASPTTPPLNEQDLYRTALNLLLEQSQYEESIRLFQSYIDNYPQGRLLTNAYYWQGEALILVSRFSEAQAVFAKIISDFPQDPKAAGAMLKLGVVHQQLGNEVQARQTWREIATRYPENITEIRAAQDYLNRQ